MKIRLKIQGANVGKWISLKADGNRAINYKFNCPHCLAPLAVRGNGNMVRHHDYYSVEAHCVECASHLGEMRTYLDTIFGLDEDERVLNGRVRVY